MASVRNLRKQLFQKKILLSSDVARLQNIHREPAPRLQVNYHTVGSFYHSDFPGRRIWTDSSRAMVARLTSLSSRWDTCVDVAVFYELSFFNYGQCFIHKTWSMIFSGIWICWIWGLSWRRRRRLWAKWQRSFGREVSSFSSLSCYTFLMKKFSLPSLSIDHSFNVQSVCWTRQGHPSCSLKGQGEVSLFKHTLLSVKRSGHLIFHGRLSVVRRFSRYRAEPFSKLRITT